MKGNDRNAYERLMQSAAKLFAQKGFDGTTTREIVADAGSSLSVLQTHFQSKEGLYQAVVKRTVDTFYQLNEPIMEQIRETEAQGILSPNVAWNLIVELTSHMVEWAFYKEYRNEILLINREIMTSDETGQSLPESVFGPMTLYEKLFEVYTGRKDQFWIKVLSFSLVTSAFDLANYPRLLNHALGCDASLPENEVKLKAYMKSYMLTCIRSALEMHKLS